MVLEEDHLAPEHLTLECLYVELFLSIHPAVQSNLLLIIDDRMENHEVMSKRMKDVELFLSSRSIPKL